MESVCSCTQSHEVTNTKPQMAEFMMCEMTNCVGMFCVSKTYRKFFPLTKYEEVMATHSHFIVQVDILTDDRITRETGLDVCDCSATTYQSKR